MWTIPNLLSILRILMVPLFVVIFFSTEAYSGLWSAATFLVAGLTDILDGMIARKYHLVSKAGKILDPLGDKLMQGAAFVCLYLKNILPLWILIIFIAKECFMLFGGAAMYLKYSDVLPSNKFGKIASAFIFISLLMCIAIGDKFGKFPIIVLYIAVGMGIIGVIKYVITFIRARKTKYTLHSEMTKDMTNVNTSK